MKSRFNYPAGVTGAEFDDGYHEAYLQWRRERQADGLPVKDFESWLEDYLDGEFEDDEQD